MEKETKKQTKGRAKKVKETAIEVSNIEVQTENVTEQETPKVKKVSEKKPKLIKCKVLKPFFGVSENKAYFIGNDFFGTFERIEEINNLMSKGRKFNALEVISNDNK